MMKNDCGTAHFAQKTLIWAMSVLVCVALLLPGVVDAKPTRTPVRQDAKSKNVRVTADKKAGRRALAAASSSGGKRDKNARSGAAASSRKDVKVGKAPAVRDTGRRGGTARSGAAERLARADKQTKGRRNVAERGVRAALSQTNNSRLSRAQRVALARQQAQDMRRQRLQQQQRAREAQLAAAQKRARMLEEESLATQRVQQLSAVRLMTPPTTQQLVMEDMGGASSVIQSHDAAAGGVVTQQTHDALDQMLASVEAETQLEQGSSGAAPQPLVQGSVTVAATAASQQPVREADASAGGLMRISVPARSSLGRTWGLEGYPGAADGLAGAYDAPVTLASRLAFAMDQTTGQVLLDKRADERVPIASLTKLMTAVVIMDAALPMDELLTITPDNVRKMNAINRSTRSKDLKEGSSLTRQEMLHLALMSSNNRAAWALGATYPGGMPAFVQAMNRKAKALGMLNTVYVEPTGLSAANQSTARDLAQLVKAAYQYPLIRTYSTQPRAMFDVAGVPMQFENTNPLVKTHEGWDVGLQKTGTTSAAGYCMVTQANIDGRNVIVVVLAAPRGGHRVRDTDAVLRWVRAGSSNDTLALRDVTGRHQ